MKKDAAVVTLADAQAGSAVVVSRAVRQVAVAASAQALEAAYGEELVEVHGLLLQLGIHAQHGKQFGDRHQQATGQAQRWQRAVAHRGVGRASADAQQGSGFVHAAGVAAAQSFDGG